MTTASTQLRRNLTLSQVALYGLGNILGAGIYVLIGEIAGIAGTLAPFAFLLAAAVAALTACSFAEFSARFPASGGGALYVHKGFKRPALTVLVGVLMIFTGVISAATISRGFVGYLDFFIVSNDNLTIVLLIAGLCALASWGIQQSVSAAAAITLIEVLGLLLIIAIAQFAELPAETVPVDNTTAAETPVAWSGLLGGAFLAFYAYVGFEDIVNVAEEAKSPRRNMPLAILIALLAATVLYALVALSALMVLSPDELAASEAPLAAVYQRATGASPWFISLISLFAVINGALIQIIMCSRICFGLAQEQLLPPILGRLNARTQTPINATVGVSALIVLAAISFSTEALARFTTTVLLIVFVLVNLALLKVKQQDKQMPADHLTIPRVVPVIGIISSLGFLMAEAYSLFFSG